MYHANEIDMRRNFRTCISQFGLLIDHRSIIHEIHLTETSVNLMILT